MIHAEKLRKKFCSEVVKGIDLSVRKGEIFALLGPNGAGKTTSVRMLTTLLPLDGGSAKVAGFDVQKEAHAVRTQIGYVSQVGGSDRKATGWENLIMQGRLHGMTLGVAMDRAQRLIDLYALGPCKNRIAGTYSGGEKRRLDLAIGMMHNPKVLFLDEPTLGLDPQNRVNLWEQVRSLRDEGVTLFLTSHYLEEVDALSDRLAIIDKGTIIAEGEPRALKRLIAEEVILIELSDPVLHDVNTLQSLKNLSFVKKTTQEGRMVRLFVKEGAQAKVPEVSQALLNGKISFQSIAQLTPTLNDLFLMKTGHSLREES